MLYVYVSIELHLFIYDSFNTKQQLLHPVFASLQRLLNHLQVGDAENWFIQIVSIANVLEMIYIYMCVLRICPAKNISASKSSRISGIDSQVLRFACSSPSPLSDGQSPMFLVVLR